MWAQLLLAFSNVLGFFAVFKKEADPVSRSVVWSYMTVGACMHLSGPELIWPFTAANEYTLYWFVDCLVNVGAFLYFMAVMGAQIQAGEMTTDRSVTILTVVVGGFVCMLVGECFEDMTYYAIFHLLWHEAAYSVMYVLA